MVREHDHEESDTLHILHCHDVAKKHPFSECAPETEVFLLLIHHFRNINISKCYETIGPVQATALFGFHTLTGCGQTGRFNGKTKSLWWKQFYCAGENEMF